MRGKKRVVISVAYSFRDRSAQALERAERALKAEVQAAKAKAEAAARTAQAAQGRSYRFIRYEGYSNAIPSF